MDRLSRAYAWGKGIAGSVGGLLSITTFADDGATPTATYIPLYDDRGNVVGLANASDGKLVAVYQYDPFGKLNTEAGDKAVLDANPFGFNTMYTDRETGLVWFQPGGYYSPALQRRLSREPAGVGESANLYVMFHNDPINRVDPDGFDDVNLSAAAIVSVEKGTKITGGRAGTFMFVGNNAYPVIWHSYMLDETGNNFTPESTAQFVEMVEQQYKAFGSPVTPAYHPRYLESGGWVPGGIVKLPWPDTEHGIDYDATSSVRGHYSANLNPESIWQVIPIASTMRSLYYNCKVGNWYGATTDGASLAFDVGSTAYGGYQLFKAARAAYIARLVAQELSELKAVQQMRAAVNEAASLRLNKVIDDTVGIRANAIRGKIMEEFGVDALRLTQTTIKEQVSIIPYLDNGELADFRVRVDAIGRELESDALTLSDFKSSSTAPLSKRQKVGYPLLERNGGMVVGKKGGTAYPKGTIISPTKVQIVDPSALRL